MEQEYYYSSLTGPQIDAALNQISQAAGYASLAAISAEKAGISAEEARRFAAETNGYSKNQSDARFASGILLEESGSAITVTGAADAPARSLRIFGSTGLSSDPAPTAPADFVSPGSIMLHIGDGTLYIPTGEGLCGIPVYHKYSAFTCVDGAGQKWICDEADLSRGVILRRLFKITLDGSEPWTQNSANPSKFSIHSGDYGPLAGFEPDENYNDAFFLCSHFQAKGYYAQADGGVCSYRAAVGGALSFWHSDCTSIASWKDYLAAQAAAGTPVTLLLRRTTPQETALDTATLNAYDALRLDGTTVITNDASAHMALTFVADTKTYIDQKIAAISAALLNS